MVWCGQWTAILRDSDFKFQEGRTADSLKKRAGLRFSSGHAAELNTLPNTAYLLLIRLKIAKP